MRIETVEIKVYKFEELTGEAKERAKEKLREVLGELIDTAAEILMLIKEESDGRLQSVRA